MHCLLLSRERQQTLEDDVDMTNRRLEVEDARQAFRPESPRDLRVHGDELPEVPLVLPRLHRVALHQPVRLVSTEAAVDQRQQQPVAEDEPFIPAPNGSSTSRTSVRARCRISSAKRSSEVATSASAESSSACRSRATTCVESGSGSSPRASHASRSTSGSTWAYVPTVPESCPTRVASSPRRRRARPRSASNAQPASFQPNVVGSAWTPCERPIVTVRRCSSARRTTAASAASTPSTTSRPAAWIWSASAVSTTSEEVRP